MSKSNIALFASVITFVSALTVAAETMAADNHAIHGSDDHANSGHAGLADSMHSKRDTSLPSEGGQSIFEALSEVITMLENDTDTDWSTVSIDNLHAHLSDMDRLMRETTSTTSVVETNKIRFEIKGTTESILSVRNMLPTHAKFIQESRGWSTKTEIDPASATLVVSVDNPDDIVFLNALGFYGFMSLDSHHQAHHYQMVRGLSH